jgi:hypothetical protein
MNSSNAEVWIREGSESEFEEKYISIRKRLSSEKVTLVRGFWILIRKNVRQCHISHIHLIVVGHCGVDFRFCGYVVVNYSGIKVRK